MNAVIRIDPAKQALEDRRDRRAKAEASTALVVRPTGAVVSDIAPHFPSAALDKVPFAPRPATDIEFHEIAVGMNNEALVMLRSLDGTISMRQMVTKGGANDAPRNAVSWLRRPRD